MTAEMMTVPSAGPAKVRATPGRLLALLVGMPLFLAAVGFSALSVVGLLARTTEHHHAVYAFRGGTLSLNIGDGNVRIQAVDTTTVDVDYTEHYQLKRPIVRASSSPGGLTLTSKCGAPPLGSNCYVNYVISVPRNVPLRLRHGDGDLTLEGLSAPVDVQAGDGGITGSQLTSKDVQVSSGDGDVNLQWSAAPSRVRSSSGDGNVTITVPHGSGPYAVTHSGTGTALIEVSTDPLAKASVTLHSGDGNTRVSYGS